MAHQYSPGFERLGRTVTRHSVLAILIWVGIAAATNLLWPQLESVANEHSVSPFPQDAPSITDMHEMAKAFKQAGADNSLIIAMSNPGGFTLEARARYTALVERLESNEAVTFVQDTLTSPQARDNPAIQKQALSPDGKAWFLLVGLTGSLGSPESMQALKVVKNVVSQTFAGSPTTALVTGSSATLGDLALQAISDTKVIGVITFILITVLLLLIYRSVFTAALPLLVMGISIVVARGTVAGLSSLGMPISSSSSALMVVIVAGACVNYTVFFISRYHENIRAGSSPDVAIAQASGSMTRVILATAATVAIANLAQLTLRLKALAASGPAVAVAIAIGFLVTATMLPAILHLAARRGIGLPRKEAGVKHWRRMAVMVVRRPKTTLAVSVAILAAFAALAPFMRFSYDDRAAQPADTESSAGYRLLDAHFPPDSLMPQYLTVRSSRDLRTPQGLADLDQMAQRISQIPGVTRVVGITRPDGQKLTQATLAWQIAAMGRELGRTKGIVDGYAPQMDKMQQLADLISGMAKDVSPAELAQLQRTIADGFRQASTASAQIAQFQQLVDQAAQSGPMLDRLITLAPTLTTTVDALNRAIGVIEPAQQALLNWKPCDANTTCVELRTQLATLVSAKNDGALATLTAAAATINQLSAEGTRPSTLIGTVRSQLSQARTYLSQLDTFKAQYDKMTDTLDRVRALGISTSDAAAMGDRVRQLRQQATDAMGTVTELSAFLQTVGKDAGAPAASGFYLPSGLLTMGDFASAAALFVSGDGKMVRYLVQTSTDPYSEEAMTLADRMREVAQQATPNTSLAADTVGIGGLPAILSDLQHVFRLDFIEIIVVTLLIILAVMCLLLRSLVAPLYLLATVLLTYLSALGVGVLVFQVILGQDLYWAVPAMTFVLVVAVGADYNMLFMSRLREEAHTGFRLGVMRAVRSTGSIITSAGMIFAAAMFGMLASGVSTMYQMGLIIGVGVLIDTLIVRSLVVPAIAVLVGTRSWWPSKLTE
ncbi:MMPL family transporter [Gordonia sp. CPCC 205333]|uniref:MMPL family transporter n=1 Tax=Gordonia sp. CPCC 205333 TaxID=3140790 RepID=UPI003AF36096